MVKHVGLGHPCFPSVEQLSTAMSTESETLLFWPWAVSSSFWRPRLGWRREGVNVWCGLGFSHWW